MNDRNVRRRIHHALDTRLSGMTGDPWLAQHIIGAEGRLRVKKKVSAGLILVLVLILIAFTALAAMTLNAFYEKTVKMESENGAIESWSADDKVAFVGLMLEAGIELKESAVAKLNDETLTESERGALAMQLITDYFPSRDGVLTSVDIIAREKGPIETWSLEDKVWLSELMAQYQPDETAFGRNLLPGDGDISKEQAEAIFFDHYEKEYGLAKDVFDLDSLTVFFGESTFDDGSGPRLLRRWVFNVDFRDDISNELRDRLHGLPDVGAYISAQGKIINAVDPFYFSWYDEWNEISSSDEFWTVEGMVRIMDEWRPRVEAYREAGDVIGIELGHLTTVDFCLPEADDITLEQARTFAAAEVIAFADIETDEIRFYDVQEACYVNEDGIRAYFFRYLPTKDAEEFGRGFFTYPSVIVYLDARTGETLDVRAGKGLYLEEII